MMTAIASLQTRTTRVEVTETLLSEAVEPMTRLDRPAISLLLRSPGSSTEAAYRDDGPRRPARIGQVIFMPPDRRVFGRGHGGQ